MPTPTTVQPPIPPQPQPLKFKVDPRKEYVSGGYYSWLGTYYRALPQHIDDLTANYGYDLYERMLLDPVVSADFNLVKLAILAAGVTLISPITDEDDPDYDKAQEIQEFCQWNVDNLPVPFEQTLDALLDGMAFGHKVAELIWGDGDDDYKGKKVIKAIKVKAQRTTAFVVDVYFNIIGILGLLPGIGVSNLISSGLIGIPSTDPASVYGPINLLPREEKFMVFSFRTRDSDPRGTSILRPAYTPWWAKQMAIPEYQKYITQFAGPTLIGYTSPDSTALPVTDSDGNPIADTNGNTQFVTPEQVLLNALVSVRNGTALALPPGSKVEPLQVESVAGSPFLDAFSYYNTEITRALLGSTLATGEAKYQSKASSETHQDALDLLIARGKKTLEQCIRQDLLTHMVRMNYGDKAVKLTPKVSLTDTQPQDFAVNATAVGTLFSSGYLHDSQLPALDAKLGIPERDLEEIAQEQAEEEAKQQELLKQMQPNNPQAQANPQQAQTTGAQKPNGTTKQPVKPQPTGKAKVKPNGREDRDQNGKGSNKTA